jgi:flagellar hook-length control protein FliK
MLMNTAGAKHLPSEGASEGVQAPAAGYFSEKKTGRKVEQGAEGFAKTLEKVQKAGQIAAARIGRSQGTEKADTKGEVKFQAKPAVTGGTLRELLSGLNDQQLVRILMKINPQELLRTVESLGLDPATLLDHVGARSSAQEKSGWSRNSLVDLLTRLSALVGEQTVLDAISAIVGPKRTANPKSGAGERAGLEKNQEIGKGRDVGKKPKVVVLDLRKGPSAPKTSEEHPNSVKSAFRLTMEKGMESHHERDVSVLFRAPHQDRAQTPVLEASASTSKPTPSFEQRFIPEVVKQTGIILKDGGNGEIRLVLKPENLGSIRIRLTLSESSLEGRIVVDNNSVKELVESSLDNLKNALRLEGYQTNLEVSVGHRRSWNGNEQAQAQPTGWLAGGGSEEFDKAVPLYLDMRPDYELVNLFA